MRVSRNISTFENMIKYSKTEQFSDAVILLYTKKKQKWECFRAVSVFCDKKKRSNSFYIVIKVLSPFRLPIVHMFIVLM